MYLISNKNYSTNYPRTGLLWEEKLLQISLTHRHTHTLTHSEKTEAKFYTLGQPILTFTHPKIFPFKYSHVNIYLYVYFKLGYYIIVSCLPARM